MTSIPSAWARAELVHGGRRDAVALAEAIGKAPAHVGAELLQDADEEEGRGDAVGVVVAVHGDRLTEAQRLVDAAPRLGHAAHQIGVVDAEVRMQKSPRRGGIAEPAAHEHLGEDLAHRELLGKPPDLRERRR
ncbi:MAG: hypothetical protein IH629_07770 [Thermoleophilia bacterium]|nr:hypothetical protein [Thermoleophilia bacterium]